MPTETVQPLSSFYSTNINNKITTYDGLCKRIGYSLGYPILNLEAHQNQVYENISIAVEMFSKFAGYTEELLAFNSELYEAGKGLKLDKLFSFSVDSNKEHFGGHSAVLSASIDASLSAINTVTVLTAGFGYGRPAVVVNHGDGASLRLTANAKTTLESIIEDAGGVMSTVAITNSGAGSYTADLGTSDFTITGDGGLGTGATLSAAVNTSLSAINTLTIVTPGSGYINPVITVGSGTGTVSGTATEFVPAYKVQTPGGGISSVVITNSGSNMTRNLTAFTDFTITDLEATSASSFDEYTEDYRKVMAVVEFNEGATTGINTLFTIEQTLAQQTYFSYSMGNYGFDLISWHVLKEWLETREKVLAQRRTFYFNEDTQYLSIIPEPRNTIKFYGVVRCYVEKPVKWLLREQWVYQYALALTKIAIAHVRGKYSGTQLFAGGEPNYSDLMSQGIAEKEKLETMLYEGTPGMGDAPAADFIVG